MGSSSWFSLFRPIILPVRRVGYIAGMRLAAFLLLLTLAACAGARQSASDRECALAQCRQILDDAAREKCMKRADTD
jgi:hypothetical protein